MQVRRILLDLKIWVTNTEVERCVKPRSNFEGSLFLCKEEKGKKEKRELKEGKESKMSRKGRMKDGIGKEGRMKPKIKIENIRKKGRNKRRDG